MNAIMLPKYNNEKGEEKNQIKTPRRVNITEDR